MVYSDLDFLIIWSFARWINGSLDLSIYPPAQYLCELSPQIMYTSFLFSVNETNEAVYSMCGNTDSKGAVVWPCR